jgi:hypothetical protein
VPLLKFHYVPAFGTSCNLTWYQSGSFEFELCPRNLSLILIKYFTC